MPNPHGKSNLNFPVPYGDVKKQTELLRSTPISGAPVSGRALGTPKRSQRQAVKPAAAPQPQSGVQQPQAQPQAPSAQPDVASFFTSAAQVDGASDLVKQYAAWSAQEAGVAQ